MTIESICEQYNITNYTINPDGSIDVNGNVNLSDKKLTKLPLKFGKVDGHFYCQNNQLTNLEGSPKSVGSFNCQNNQLTNLEGSPVSVGSSFYCYNNQLTDYSEILNIDIKGKISIDGKNYITKQNILIMSLNNILKPHDLIIDSNYVIKDVFDNIVIRSNNTNLKNDVMELVV